MKSVKLFYRKSRHSMWCETMFHGCKHTNDSLIAFYTLKMPSDEVTAFFLLLLIILQLWCRAKNKTTKSQLNLFICVQFNRFYVWYLASYFCTWFFGESFRNNDISRLLWVCITNGSLIHLYATMFTNISIVFFFFSRLHITYERLLAVDFLAAKIGSHHFFFFWKWTDEKQGHRHENGDVSYTHRVWKREWEEKEKTQCHYNQRCAPNGSKS